MAKKDQTMTRMFEYLDHAKNLLQEDGDLLPTVFAHCDEGTIILPIFQPEGQTSENSTEVIGKVICAYDCYEYFVIVESFRQMQQPDGSYQTDECANVLYVTPSRCKVLSASFKRIGKEFHFGESVEVQPTRIEGTITKLFRLFEHTLELSDRDKEHIRIMFPIQSEDELFTKDHPLN